MEGSIRNFRYNLSKRTTSKANKTEIGRRHLINLTF